MPKEMEPEGIFQVSGLIAMLSIPTCEESDYGIDVLMSGETYSHGRDFFAGAGEG